MYEPWVFDWAFWVANPETDLDWDELATFFDEGSGAETDKQSAEDGAPSEDAPSEGAATSAEDEPGKQPEDGGGDRDVSPLRKVFEVAKVGGAKTVVFESRYIDVEFRSEHAAFWTQRFLTKSPFTWRAHFFAAKLSPDEIARLQETDKELGYLGYMVIRPLPHGRVGRTLLRPPRSFLEKTESVFVSCRDNVSLFGVRLPIQGAPFVQQDGEYVRCAHAAIWICHYAAVLRGLAARHSTAELVSLVPQELSTQRSLPSGGLNSNQIQYVFGETRTPAVVYELGSLPFVQGVPEPDPVEDQEPGEWDSRVYTILCRYLNSGFPVLVSTQDHAFVVVGYHQDGGKLVFVVHDDQRGPYDEVDDPLKDIPERGPWQMLMVPLPPRVFLTGELAESNAFETVIGPATDPSLPERWQDLGNLLGLGILQPRTFLKQNREYKEALELQERDLEVTAQLRLARMAHWVWIVEFHDMRETAKGNAKRVCAEFVFDATSSDEDPIRLAVSYPDLTTVVPPAGPGHSYEVEPGEIVEKWKSQMPRGGLEAAPVTPTPGY